MQVGRGGYACALQLENVLLQPRAGGMVTKITDFGLAKDLSQGQQPEPGAEAMLSSRNDPVPLATLCGTPYYIAPEVTDSAERAGTVGKMSHVCTRTDDGIPVSRHAWAARAPLRP